MKFMKERLLDKSFNSIKKVVGVTSMALLMLGTQSCQDTFLDVVPDNVETIDLAFKLRNEAEKYLFTCYSYMPKNGDAIYNIGMLAGNETWIQKNGEGITSFAFAIARGLQRTTNPYMDVWEGRYQGAGWNNDGYKLFIGIRHCNIFLDNIANVPDLTEAERLRWEGEVKFLKAYFHYYLMRMYGPIPVMRENIAIDAPLSLTQVSREPIDPTVDYIVELLDEAAILLPPQIQDTQNELGRLTSPAAKGLKAEVLLTAASPLFNGNTDMAGFNTKDGQPFFNPTYDVTKWQRAADAAKEAIELAEANGHAIFYKDDVAFDIEASTRTKLNISQAVTERWNSEVIWANTTSRTYELQRLCMVPTENNSDIQPWHARRIMSPPINTAKVFYTKNGVPLEEDNTTYFNEEWDILTLQEAKEADRYDIQLGAKTSMLNFNREPRFYADLAFDKAVWYKFDSGSEDDRFHVEAKFKDYGGSSDAFDFNVTGYYIKKLINWEQHFGGGLLYKDYAWPELRLADLYLMYAEAANEAQDDVAARNEAIAYVDVIRARAGLEGVVSSWTTYSKNPAKFTTQVGLRKIIQRERKIEMMFEGKGYWDERRWKTAISTFNQPIEGWNVAGSTEADYYQVRTLWQQRFAPRDYFWPINTNTLIQNPNLVQNPGW